MDIKSISTSHSILASKRQAGKIFKQTLKVADQKSPVPARISSPKHSPPPVKQGQKILFKEKKKKKMATLFLKCKSHYQTELLQHKNINIKNNLLVTS